VKTLRKNILYIYTDGSSFSGPRKGGIGVRYVILDNWEKEIIVDKELFGYQQGSNNQMELKACVLALENCLNAIPDIAFDSIEIRSDSSYVTDNVSNAKYVWPKAKWLSKDGKPILNVEIWKDLCREIQRLGVRIDFQWVKGHAKDEHNKAVDKAAKVSAKSAINDPLSIVTVRRKKTKQKTKIGSVGIIGQCVGIRIVTSEYLKTQKVVKYRYEIVSEDSIDFEKIDIAYSNHFMRDAHSYLVQFNDLPGNPRILDVIEEIDAKPKTG
jgi:ribonuclease HI